jgi:probable HAF family extracellular repeat protein
MNDRTDLTATRLIRWSLALAVIQLSCAEPTPPTPAIDPPVVRDMTWWHPCTANDRLEPGRILPKKVVVPDTVALRSPLDWFFQPSPPRTIVEVIPGHGVATQVSPGGIKYQTPRCIGVDSVWFVSRWPTGQVDTSLISIRLRPPAIAQQASTQLWAGAEVTTNFLSKTANRGFNTPRVVGIANSSILGTIAIVDDSLIRYTAPGNVDATDSVRAIFEATFTADFGGASFRDTTLLVFDFRYRSPPGPYTVEAITAPSLSLTARSLSADGKVVGTAALSNGETRAYRWVAGTFTDLGLHGGLSTVGVGINAAGDVAGYALKPDLSRSTVVWKANGQIWEVPGGSPLSLGISESGVVVVGREYWRDGQQVRTLGDATTKPATLTTAGDVLSTSDGPPNSIYPAFAVWWSDGRVTPFGYGHGSWPVIMNDSSDVWGKIGTNPQTEAIFERASRNGQSRSLAISSAFPELLPPGAVGLRPQTKLKLDNNRNLLTTDLIVTARGAFRIDDYILDPNWELVDAISMNDRGQILGIGRNVLTGVTTPILLNPPPR